MKRNSTKALIIEMGRVQNKIIFTLQQLQRKEKFHQMMQECWWKFKAPVVPPLGAIIKVQETGRYVHWENVFWDGKTATAMFYRTRPATIEEQEEYEDRFITHLLPGSPEPTKNWLHRIPYSIRSKRKPNF